MFATRLLSSAIASAILLAFAPTASAHDASYDPPDRVVRLAYQSGDVEFASAGDNNWGSADVNRPLGIGDRLETGSRGRVALDLGDASVALDNDSAFNVLDIDSSVAQFELSQGTMNLRVRRFDPGQTYEVDTPTVAFVASRPGRYRIDVAPDGNGSMVTVFSGAGTVYGENGVSSNVVAGHLYRFADSGLSSITTRRIPAPDAFDRFCSNRDLRYSRSISRHYVSADVIGYDDLDGYGDWRSSSEYGDVWYPNQVASDWAPYRDGRWEWVDPWGWTWVDNAPWGFAPSHYGRWANIDNRWGWIPGRSSGRAIYAPALVVFINALAFGGGQPVGWFPLGPRDVYQPWYPVSHDYFTNVNVTNVRVINTTIINNTYNNYITNSPGASITYNNRSVPGAVTVVPNNVFTNARPVAAAALQVTPQALAQARPMPRLRIAPNAASLGVRPGMRSTGAQELQFAHPVIARHAPPAPAAPFAERLKVITNQGGAPLAPAQIRELRQASASERRSQPHVVMAAPGGGTLGSAARTEPVARPEMRTPPNGARAQNPPDQPMRAGELPSARFAHPRAQERPAAAQPENTQSPRANPAVPPLQGNTGGDQTQQQRAMQRASRRDAQVPRAQDAQEQPPRASPMPEAVHTPRDEQRMPPTPEVVRAPRRDAQVLRAQDAQEQPPRRDAQVLRAQDAQEQPPRASRMPEAVHTPRDEQRMAPTPEVVRAPRRDAQMQRAQDAQEQPPRRDAQVLRAQDAPEQPPIERPRMQERPQRNNVSNADSQQPQEPVQRPMQRREPPVMQEPPVQRPEPRVRQAPPQRTDAPPPQVQQERPVRETPEQRKKRLQDEQDLRDQQEQQNPQR